MVCSFLACATEARAAASEVDWKNRRRLSMVLLCSNRPLIPVYAIVVNVTTMGEQHGQSSFGRGRQSPILGTSANREEGPQRHCDESRQARGQDHARRRRR